MKLEPKPIPGFEDRYYLDPDRMCVVNSKTGRSLKPYPDGAGYAEVQLWRNNKGTHKNLHRLFAEAYIPNPEGYPNINHKDENTMNYSLNNLEWCTQSYNQKYGTANAKRGPKISAATKGKPRPHLVGKFGKPVIAIDKDGVETWYQSSAEAARVLGLDRNGIASTARGEQKTHFGYRFRHAD